MGDIKVNINSLEKLGPYLDAIIELDEFSILSSSLLNIKNRVLLLQASDYISEDSLEYEILHDYIKQFTNLIEKPKKNVNDIANIYYFYEHIINSVNSIEMQYK